MQSRKEYIDQPFVDRETSQKRHRAYYAQFVTPFIIDAVVRQIGADRLRKSTKESFNDIPLGEWDHLHGQMCGQLWKQANPGWAPALMDSGCIAKEAARQFVEMDPASRREWGLTKT